ERPHDGERQEQLEQRETAGPRPSRHRELVGGLKSVDGVDDDELELVVDVEFLEVVEEEVGDVGRSGVPLLATVGASRSVLISIWRRSSQLTRTSIVNRRPRAIEPVGMRSGATIAVVTRSQR